MPPIRNSSRVDTSALKDLLFQKIGRQRAVQYFNELKRLISCNISRTEFDQRCIRIIGRENIPLHNRLITSILNNACCSSVPPPFKCIRKVGGSHSVKVTNGYQRNCLQSLYKDAFPPAPRKGRSRVNRSHKFRDQSSPLGPLEKHQNVAPETPTSGALEQLSAMEFHSLGKPQDVALKRLTSDAQEQSSATEFESLGKPQDVVLKQPTSDAQEQPSATELHSLESHPPIEVVSAEEEVEQVTGRPGTESRSPAIMAPLGMSMNFVGAHRIRTLDKGNYDPWICQRRGELPDTKSLTSHVEQKLELEGISVPVESANLLNNALDIYLKRLLEPCFNLGELRYEDERKIPGSRGMLHARHNSRADRSTYASMLDFRTTMELVPEYLEIIGQYSSRKSAYDLLSNEVNSLEILLHLTRTQGMSLISSTFI